MAAIVALAAAIRTARLDLRPFHGDEAVHAYKFNELLTGEGYRYDPREFHGPTLNYFTLPIAWLRGASDYTQLEMSDFRIVTAVFGIGLILLLPLVADGLGRGATLCAGLLIALSPLLGFCSRYYVQETLLVFFTFAVIACGWRYMRATGGASKATWAILAGVAAGLMHATKETCLIAFAAMGMALVCAAWTRRGLADGVANAPQRSTAATGGGRYGAEGGGRDRATTGGAGVRPWHVLLACLATAATSATFYSSFFTNPSGPLDSLRAVAVYFTRGMGASVHIHPWFYYLKMLCYTHDRAGPVWSEGLIVALAAIGLIAAIRGGAIARAPDNHAYTARDKRTSHDDRTTASASAHVGSAKRGDPTFIRFIAFYTVIMVAVYSALPYKTPWSMLGFVHGLTLLGGVGAVALLRWLRRRPAQIAAAVLMLAAAAQLGMQSVRTNLDPRFVADPRNPYVYAHPLRGVVLASDFAQRLAAIHPDGDDMLVKVIMPNPWPMPWYLRKLHRVGYWEQPPEDCDAPVVITATDAPDLAGCLRDSYYGPRRYGLRPDVSLIMYVESGLMQRFIESEKGAAAASNRQSKIANRNPAGSASP